jgi:restriction endonuclease S subunit
LVLNFEGQHPIVIIIKDIDIEIEFHKKKIEKIKKIKQDIMQELLTSRTCLV